jgi:HD-GYP domain-containing protein (c-di-GMP phosphodiesterase class II)
MTTQAIYEIETSDLDIGTTLPFDLRGPDGNIVHKSGLPITQRLLDRLNSLGVTMVTVRGESKEPAATAILHSFFDPALIQEITHRLDESIEELGNSIERLLSGQSIRADALNDHVDSFVSQAANDTSAVLAVLTQHNPTSDVDLLRAISERSTCHAFLSIAIATALGLPEEVVARTGKAALLSDVSLAEHPDWFDSRHALKPGVYDSEDYQDHPVNSSRLLHETGEFDDDLIECIAQSHELADGSGFPYALRSDTTLLESRVVSLAEIYSAMTSPHFLESPYLESDVLAYLLHQTVRGGIDRTVLKGFIKSLSMYPIGSLVRLDDDSCAIVVQPNASNPFQPMVKMYDSTSKVKDLSISNNYIVGPAVEKTSNRRRIEKSKLDSILWRPMSEPS